MKLAQGGQDLVADQSALRGGVRGVVPVLEPLGTAVCRGLRTPDAAAGDARCRRRGAPGSRWSSRSRRAGRAPSRPGPTPCGPSPEAAPRRPRSEGPAARASVQTGARGVDDLGSERLGAEARVLRGLPAAQAVVDVQRGHAVAEAAQRMQRQVESCPPETRHVTPPPGWIRSCRRTCSSIRARISPGSTARLYGHRPRGRPGRAAALDD